MAMIKVPAGKCFIKHGTAVNALYMVCLLYTSQTGLDTLVVHAVNDEY